MERKELRKGDRKGLRYFNQKACENRSFLERAIKGRKQCKNKKGRGNLLQVHHGKKSAT